MMMEEENPHWKFKFLFDPTIGLNYHANLLRITEVDANHSAITANVTKKQIEEIN